MLTSITPLGERGRGSRWGVTVAFLVAGSALGGVAAGAAFGLAGELVLPGGGGPLRLAALAAVLAAGLALDLGVASLRLPSVRRQVDERWLGAYRGWVYGAGFGLQLGAGLVTVVTASATYATFAASFLSAGLAPGALIGGVFGLARGATVLGAWRVRDPARLVALGRRIARLEPAARRLALAGEAALAVAALALAVALA